MFKIINSSGGVFKAHEIEEVYNKIILNSDRQYHFFWYYTHLTNDQFLKLYLVKSNNHKNYTELFQIIKNPRLSLQNSNPELYQYTKEKPSIFNYVNKL